MENKYNSCDWYEVMSQQGSIKINENEKSCTIKKRPNIIPSLFRMEILQLNLKK